MFFPDRSSGAGTISRLHWRPNRIWLKTRVKIVTMNGAESLVKTLLDGGVEVCFANPGTSEMHCVAAFDQIPGIRCVLGLFEGVVTGAADGYARMADKPAATLLHLGPGLGNGLANLHNAKKASTPVINIVGEHALNHIEFNAPLTADIEGIARPVSHWVRTAKSAQGLSQNVSEAIQSANTAPGQVATLILPANTAWDEASTVATVPATESPSVVEEKKIAEIATTLSNGKRTLLLLGDKCLRGRPLGFAAQIAKATGADMLAETSNARHERGEGRVHIACVPYPVDQALETLAPFEQIITVCAKPPVAFFGYPEKPSELWNSDAEILQLAAMTENGPLALEHLTDYLGAGQLAPVLQEWKQSDLPTDGTLTAELANRVIAYVMPDQAIIVDEAITSGRTAQKLTASCKPHDWLQIVGGSIGIGFPLATGAAIACPDRKVIALQADGSGMYTLQALWTQARENLNITTIIYSNRSYAILQGELANVQASSGAVADSMMRLDNPDLDWVSLARGMGVEGRKANTVTAFKQALEIAMDVDGPFLIEAEIQP